MIGAVVALASLFPLGPIPVAPVALPPAVSEPATAAVSVAALDVAVLDRDSDAVLVEKRADEQVAIGSITKLMTALVVLDSGVALDDRVIVSVAAAATPGSRMGAVAGDELSVRDLLQGLLIPSGNDAAVALAERVGVDAGVSGFVARMNETAATLGLAHTHFANPTGLDQDGNYSSAHDLTQLMDYALTAHGDLLLDLFSKKSGSVEVLNKPGQTRSFEATDELVGTRADILGGKTGHTDAAGYCFLGVARRDGHEVITVVLHARDRFAETAQLVDWTYTNYHWN